MRHYHTKRTNGRGDELLFIISTIFFPHDHQTSRLLSDERIFESISKSTSASMSAVRAPVIRRCGSNISGLKLDKARLQVPGTDYHVLRSLISLRFVTFFHSIQYIHMFGTYIYNVCTVPAYTCLSCLSSMLLHGVDHLRVRMRVLSASHKTTQPSEHSIRSWSLQVFKSSRPIGVVGALSPRCRLVSDDGQPLN